MFSCLCFRGTQTINLTVKEGGPLPFAYDILTSQFQYGNKVFTKYPEDIPDYFKQTFPEGYSWERSMTYEDQGSCTATSDIKLVRCKADASCRGKRRTVFQIDKICLVPNIHFDLNPFFIVYHFVGVYS